MNFIDDARDEIKQIIETCRTENPKLNEARQTISEQLARTADAKNTAVQSNSEFMRLSRAEAAWAAMLGLTACDPYVSVRVVALQTELAAPDPADVIKKMSETLRRWLANTRIS
ncbi:hypothetical protein [Pseudovibrio axinellae]|uniref:hypothetical protein n=1 Tax=Pseudovibrio axinellae TaxID=989403 RepID=UPI00137B1FE4|nr:hypothetical protein [Pseudovibrio axinellae]